MLLNIFSGEIDTKSFLGKVANGTVNNCKPDYNPSKLFFH
jgi:hypothetical protein